MLCSYATIVKIERHKKADKNITDILTINARSSGMLLISVVKYT